MRRDRVDPTPQSILHLLSAYLSGSRDEYGPKVSKRWTKEKRRNLSDHAYASHVQAWKLLNELVPLYVGRGVDMGPGDVHAMFMSTAMWSPYVCFSTHTLALQAFAVRSRFLCLICAVYGVPLAESPFASSSLASMRRNAPNASAVLDDMRIHSGEDAIRVLVYNTVHVCAALCYCAVC